MLTLWNRTKSIQPYNLDHEHYCVALGRCVCVPMARKVFARDPVTGIAGLRDEELLVPRVLTLLAGEKRSGLPHATRQATEIAAAINLGHLRVLDETQE